MQVVKSSGKIEGLNYGKIARRVKKQAAGLSPLLDPDAVVTKVAQGITNRITTAEIDELIWQVSASLTRFHPDYSRLAARIWITRLHKNTPSKFYGAIKKLYQEGFLEEPFYEFVREHADELNAMIDDSRDRDFYFFGIATLDRAYLLRDRSGAVVERPQYMYMRVAVDLARQAFPADSARALRHANETYNALSRHVYSHATPTYFNAGTRIKNLASCFQTALPEDSREGIQKCDDEASYFSKLAGGNGISFHNIRSAHAAVGSTGKKAGGIAPFCAKIELSMQYFNQGGKRAGAAAMYLDDVHPEFASKFVFMKRADGAGGGKERFLRATDLFYSTWLSDAFMEAAERGAFGLDDSWKVFDPSVVRRADKPLLSWLYGESFEKAIAEFASAGLSAGSVNATKVLKDIADTAITEGMPYINFKDAYNRRSNYKSHYPILNSNLCSEMAMPATPKEWSEWSGKERAVSVCFLSSLNALRIVNADGSINHEVLSDVMPVIVRNLDMAIDAADYKYVPEAAKTSARFRPLGIGLQGLADARMRARLPFESDEFFDMNLRLSQAIYYHAVKASMELAKEKGPCEGFEDSPLSQGRFAFDLYAEETAELVSKWRSQADELEKLLADADADEANSRVAERQLAGHLREWADRREKFLGRIGPQRFQELDWESLRADVMKHGVRNLMLVAYMPTATTANILDNCEGREDAYLHVQVRETSAGDFLVINKHLVSALEERGLWTPAMSELIKKNSKTIAHLDAIPSDIRNIFTTVFEQSQMTSIDMAAATQAYTCHSLSFNLFKLAPRRSDVTLLWFYAWRMGLKTGMYYLKSVKDLGGMQMKVEKFTGADADNDIARLSSPDRQTEGIQEDATVLGAAAGEAVSVSPFELQRLSRDDQTDNDGGCSGGACSL